MFVNWRDPTPPGKSFSNISAKLTEIELNEDSILKVISDSISLICELSSFFVNSKSSIEFCISSYLVFNVS